MAIFGLAIKLAPKQVLLNGCRYHLTLSLICKELDIEVRTSELSHAHSMSCSSVERGHVYMSTKIECGINVNILNTDKYLKVRFF